MAICRSKCRRRPRRPSFGRGWIPIRRTRGSSQNVSGWCVGRCDPGGFARFFAESGDSLDHDLLGLNAALAQMQDREAVRAIIEPVTDPYRALEADFARGACGLQRAGDTLSAMTRIDQALALRSD